MALGEFKLFRLKSKKQVEKEQSEYAAWAFPYGQLQRERLTKLMKELDPKASPQISLASYLTCKELYETQLAESESDESTVDEMINTLKSYNQLIRKNEMPFYLALVLADAKIDENCDYPTVDIMREKINELEGIRKERKGWRINK